MTELAPGVKDELLRVLRFGLAGLANTLVGGAAILVLQLQFGANPFAANAGGFAIGMALGFFLSRAFVFRVQDNSRATKLRYVAAVALAFALNQLVLAMLSGAMTGAIAAALVQGAAVASYTIALFALSRFWVFADLSGRDGARP